jgi:DNA-directed RNA polymerase subunit M/transcription elongation factor TFIIS
MLDISLETGSKILINKLLDNDIDINEIARKTCKELCPEKYEEMAREIERRSNTEHSIKSTTLHYCRKCKKNNTTQQSIQNRSGDEGNTYLITCLFCHNKWFGG